jgi:hypothetical protein
MTYFSKNVSCSVLLVLSDFISFVYHFISRWGYYPSFSEGMTFICLVSS